MIRYYLSKLSIFAALSQDEIDTIHTMTTTRPVAKHTILQPADTPLKALFFLKEGTLHCYSTTPEGRQFTHDILPAGTTFGATEHFSMGLSNCTIETWSDALICHFDTQAFDQFLRERPQLLIRLLKNLSARLDGQNQLLLGLATMNIKTRLLFRLTILARDHGNPLPLPITHQGLADMIGATRESVTHNMKSLVKEGKIESTPEGLFIPHLSAFSEIDL